MEDRGGEDEYALKQVRRDIECDQESMKERAKEAGRKDRRQLEKQGHMDEAQAIFSQVRSLQNDALSYMKKGSMMVSEAAMSTLDQSDLGVVTRCTLHHGTMGIIKRAARYAT